MNIKTFQFLTAAAAVIFAVGFCVLVVPPLLASGDIWGAAMAGFVNPYSSGYALDAIMCWAILAVWVIYEARAHGIKHGWVALLLGVVPGVATGFGLYLLIRMQQLKQVAK